MDDVKVNVKEIAQEGMDRIHLTVAKCGRILQT
jgi:hypothetical protein